MYLRKSFENLSINKKAGLLSNILLNFAYLNSKKKKKTRSKIGKEYYRKDQDLTIFAKPSRIYSECTDLKRNAEMSYIKKGKECS